MRTPLNFENTYHRLPEHFYTKQKATPLIQPQLAAFSQSAAALIGLQDGVELRQQLTAVGSGNAGWDGADPLAMIYSGHQFGVYNSQLGDGRGLLLGEVKHKSEKWDLHLKGGGRTPYSRFGDGRAVLRSCIREFLGSEAMFHLGIPTTRGLCVVSSETDVYRETKEKGAALLRLAKTHIRFGHFEYFSYSGQPDDLRILADYTIALYFPHLLQQQDRYLFFFREVLEKTAKMVALWQAVGFAHGVMNTDNMSILGETFDYGPFGFLDDFDWGYICNHSDHNGRYSFGQQPDISYWNCGRLGSALMPLLEKNADCMQSLLDSYPALYSDYYSKMMAKKLGLVAVQEDDHALIQTLLRALQTARCDYTRFFRALCDFKAGQGNAALKQIADSKALENWLLLYKQRLKQNPLSDQNRSREMKKVNPKYILRNYLAQQAIELAHTGDYSEVNRLIKVLSAPFDEQPDEEVYAAEPPEWGKKLEISCSS